MSLNLAYSLCPSPEFFKKLFSCSTQLSMNFKLLIKTDIPRNEEASFLSFSGVVFIMLINVKMPTIVGILTFMSRINYMLSRVKHGKFYSLGALSLRNTAVFDR